MMHCHNFLQTIAIMDQILYNVHMFWNKNTNIDFLPFANVSSCLDDVPDDDDENIPLLQQQTITIRIINAITQKHIIFFSDIIWMQNVLYTFSCIRMLK